MGAEPGRRSLKMPSEKLRPVIVAICTCRTSSHWFREKEWKNICAAQWADYQWNAEWTDSPTGLCIFITNTGTHPAGMTLPKRAWVRLNRLRTSVTPACTNGVWPPLRSVSVAQKNKQSTMLSSNVQSIYFPMDCMA